MNLSAANSVGARIKQIRAHKSQATMADELGMSLRTFQNYERDEREISSEALVRLNKLGWNPNWILTGEGPERLADSDIAFNDKVGLLKLITDKVLLVPGLTKDERRRARDVAFGVFDNAPDVIKEGLQGPDSLQSQALIPEKLTLAVQLAQEALDGNVLDPPDYAELLGLIYHALVNGLESAQVLAFAKPAARGLGVSDGRKTVGGSGKQTAG